MEEGLCVFEKDTLRIACISDTHNDHPKVLPSADILIHAGDLTDGGSQDELNAVFQWLSELPHLVKIVIAGNHDCGLDQDHSRFSYDAYTLFTSAAAKESGIYYIDREVMTVAYYRSEGGSLLPLRVYGNPMTPDLIESDYAFTHKPCPSKSADQAWESAPNKFDPDNYVQIFVTHGPPYRHLDDIFVPGITGCPVTAKLMASSKPLLCVFGHFHLSHGWKITEWRDENPEDASDASSGADDREAIFARNCLVPEHLLKGQGRASEPQSNALVVDLEDAERVAKPGRNTTFINAARMTRGGRKVNKRNAPFLVKLKLTMP